MKKKFILFILAMFMAVPAFANCEYSDFCAKAPYGLSSSAAQTFSNITGATYLGQTVAQGIIKKQLKKATKQNFSVKVKAYSVQDLKAGKFKSLKVSGKNLNFDGIALSSLEFNTLCDFNYFDLNTKTLQENMALKFAIEMSDSDLRSTMRSSGYLDMLNNVSFSSMGINLLKFNGADVRVKNGKVYFIIKVSSQLLLGKKEMEIVVGADVKVKDGKIVLTQAELENTFARIDLSKITSLLNAIDPLTFTTNVLGTKDTKVSLQNINILGNRILVTGNVFIPKGTKIK
jgi:virulence-associated protein VapD